jgi:hypothetical protein
LVDRFTLPLEPLCGMLGGQLCQLSEELIVLGDSVIKLAPDEANLAKLVFRGRRISLHSFLVF